MAHQSMVENALEQGQGVLRLVPTWVPRSFCIPGKRIKLHPDDYYKLGLVRGGIDERWFSSTVHADNGPLTPGDEGLSYIVYEDGSSLYKFTLLEAVELLQDQIIGQRLWDEYGKWPMFSKFFDNWGPLPFHIHQDDDHANLVGEAGKPEMYYFPTQLNNHGGTFPFTFFGLNPGTTKAQLKECLATFELGDNKSLDLSRAYKLRPGTGWDVPPGILHAPGSLCTYEPQFASDVFAMYESVLYGGETVPVELLWKNTPEDKIGDLDYLVSVVDWELNTDPNFFEHRFMAPVPVVDATEQAQQGFRESWICYRSAYASAKRLVVQPGMQVVVQDQAAYGFINVQGHGTINGMPLETPALIGYGDLTCDEYFVTESAAVQGVTITNQSMTESLVMLKHFGPGNPELTPMLNK